MIARAWLVWLAVCGGAAPAPTEGPPVAVEALGLDSAQPHFVSGQRIVLPLRFYGAQGQRLDLRAQPYQLARALAAPAGPPIDVATDFQLGHAAWHDFTLTLDTPTLLAPTVWELRFESRIVGADSWEVLGATQVHLHPPGILEPLRSLATTQRWFVFDTAGGLKEFLGAHGIAFEDLTTPGGRSAFERMQRAGFLAPGSTARRQSLVLWVRNLEHTRRRPTPRHTRMPDSLWRTAPRALVFDETTPFLPYTTLRLQEGRTRVTTDIHLLSSLKDDPRAQLAFVEAIRMTQCDLGESSDE